MNNQTTIKKKRIITHSDIEEQANEAYKKCKNQTTTEAIQEVKEILSCQTYNGLRDGDLTKWQIDRIMQLIEQEKAALLYTVLHIMEFRDHEDTWEDVESKIASLAHSQEDREGK